MGNITKLSNETVSQIAAGEVIERPSFVVKELIENSLDAGARSISINLIASGVEEIQVIDDGVGMNAKNLAVSFLPHTTSKIKTIEDLSFVKTLGFRGEALSSIASVASLTIASRLHEANTGNQVIVVQGQATFEPVGMRPGTKVTVSNLFEKTPARRKFLKQQKTELRHSLEMIWGYTLSHPEISWSVTHNKETLINLPSQNEGDRLCEVFGESLIKQLFPIESESSYVSVKGFVSRPQAQVASSNKLYIYVNGRRVSDEIVMRAVREAYGNLLMSREYPIGIIKLTVPSEFLDVNVHPTKTLVRFLHPNEVFHEVKIAISEALNDHNLTYHNLNFSGYDLVAKTLRTEVESDAILTIGKFTPSSECIQIHNTYLLIESERGVMLIDQHAAHESLLYSKFKKLFKEKIGKSVPLSETILIELTPPQIALVNEHETELHDIGFGIEHFGDNTYKIDAIPEVYIGQSIKNSFIDLVNGLPEVLSTEISGKQNRFLATLACKTAIKAGTPLSPHDREELLSALHKEHYAYTCPHGRPVKLEISISELEKLFRRKK